MGKKSIQANFSVPKDFHTRVFEFYKAYEKELHDMNIRSPTALIQAACLEFITNKEKNFKQVGKGN